MSEDPPVVGDLVTAVAGEDEVGALLYGDRRGAYREVPDVVGDGHAGGGHVVGVVVDVPDAHRVVAVGERLGRDRRGDPW